MAIDPANLNALTLAVDANHDGTPDTLLVPDGVLDAAQAQDFTPPVTTLQVDGVKNASGYYQGSLTVTLSAADSGVGVANSLYSLDFGHTWQVYSAPVSLQAAVTPVFYAYSVDKAGNQEYPLHILPIQRLLFAPMIY